MIRTNSKKAIENIRKYILENFTPYYEGDVDKTDFKKVAKYIQNAIYTEKIKYDKNAWRYSKQDIFKDWAQGLPSILDTCYYCNRSAVDDLAIILEETEEEKNKYTQEEAEELLTYLLYREIYKIN